MKVSDKIKYMVIGAVIALVGFGLGTLVTGINAQDNLTHYDAIHANKIVATEWIAVGDAEGSSILLGATEHGGDIRIYNKEHEEKISLYITEHGGSIYVSSNKGKGYVSVNGDLFDGGMVSAGSNDGEGIFSLSSGGGWIFVKKKRGGVYLNSPVGSLQSNSAGSLYVTDEDGRRHQVMVNWIEH